MKDSLARFGVAMEDSLLAALDSIVEERGSTRSEVLRDLTRAEVMRAKLQTGATAVATLTLVYDHHVRDLTRKLTDFQHDLGSKVTSTLHVHLDHDHCLEVIVLRGAARELERASKQLLATRGVTHGGVEIIALPHHVDDDVQPNAKAPARRRDARQATQDHAGDSGHRHATKRRSAVAGAKPKHVRPSRLALATPARLAT